jgi:hypothetical protein
MAVAAVATGGWCLLGVGVPASDGARTTADEPQYLLTATSLSEDGDLDIADELADERWRAWHRAPLPEQTEALAGGRRVSPHDPLLPLLLALPVRVGGWAGAKVALAGLAGALAAALVWVAARRLAVPTGTALVAVLCFTLSAPLAAYGSQLYPELPAALVVTVGLGAVTGPLRRTGPIAVLGACAVALPWLSVKYAPVAAALAAAGLWRLWRRGDRRAAGTLAAALAAAGAVSAAGHLALYGGLTPYAVGDHFAGGELTVMGRSPDHLGRSHRLIGLLVDRDFGLVAWQPAWLLALPALGALARRRPPWAGPVAVVLATGWLIATFVALTMHGWWWPGRQVVAVLPAAVLVVAWWAGAVAPRARGLVVAGLAVGALTFGWLAVEGLVGRLTLVVDPWRTTGPHRLLRPLLPDLAHPGPAGRLGELAWVAAAVALGIWGWRSARLRRLDEDAAAGEGAEADVVVVDAHGQGAVR